MSEKARPHQGINLDEIERHIRQASALPASGGAAEDPLAELARIVSGAPVTRRETPRVEAAPVEPPRAPYVRATPSLQPPQPQPQSSTVLAAQTARAVIAPQPQRIEPVFHSVAETPQSASTSRSEFASIEDDIERLLQRDAPPAPRRRPDDLEDAMRSLDNLLKTSAPKPAPPSPVPATATTTNFPDWSLRNATDHAPPEPAPPQFDFDAELACASREADVAPSYAAASHEEPLWREEAAEMVEPEPAPRKSRRPLVMVAAVMGIAALGIGGALSMRSGGGKFIGGGSPPLIVADKGPIKIAPANPGGLEIPDQNRQILERNLPAPKLSAKVVNSEEQPLDLREAVRREAAAAPSNMTATDAPKIVASISMPSGPAPAPTVAAPAAVGSIPTAADIAATAQPEPKRVRTVAIKPPEPGSTQVQPTAPLPAPVIAAPAPPPPEPPKPAATPLAAAPTPAPSVAATPPQPAPVAAAQSAAPQAAPPPPPKPKVQGSIGASREANAAARQQAQAKPAPSPVRAPETIDDAANGSGPLQITPPNRSARSSQPPQRVAAIEPPAPAPTASEAAPTHAGGGSFVVQLASEGSDGDARSAIGRLQSRYSELGSLSSSVQRREVKGQMRYRVRFGSMSREEAGQLCASLKSKGQDCILQPN
ncbi:SPOR domain-containing protein [Terrarubrum flagellatum]|uniref:SPOR domain-containing protein n=1 Tax=Terrirubrum flagellatum TaxID=2895980 RepID=UPI0031456439